MAYSDASFAACPSTRRSITGSTLLLYGVAVSWKSNRQAIVSLGTAHAETIAKAETLQWVMALTICRLCLPQRQDEYSPVPPVIMVDCQPALDQVAKEFTTSASRHYSIRLNFVLDFVESFVKVPTRLMNADALTKVPSKEMINQLYGLVYGGKAMVKSILITGGNKETKGLNESKFNSTLRRLRRNRAVRFEKSRTKEPERKTRRKVRAWRIEMRKTRKSLIADRNFNS